MQSSLQGRKSICVLEAFKKGPDDEEHPKKNAISCCYFVHECFTSWFALSQFLRLGIFFQPLSSEKKEVVARQALESWSLVNKTTKSSLETVTGATGNAYLHVLRLCDGLQHTNGRFVICVVIFGVLI